MRLMPAITRRLVERYAAEPAPDAKAFAELTPREVDVVRLVARGLSNAEIGGELFLSEATVKTHLTSVLRKVGLRDRTQLVVSPTSAGSSGRATPGSDGDYALAASGGSAKAIALRSGIGDPHVANAVGVGLDHSVVDAPGSADSRSASSPVTEK
jgi:DNA-binding CsgD family transcriptional regulator